MQTHVCSPSYVRSLNPSVSPNHGNSRLTHVISGSDLKFGSVLFSFFSNSNHIYTQEISASIPRHQLFFRGLPSLLGPEPWPWFPPKVGGNGSGRMVEMVETLEFHGIHLEKLYQVVQDLPSTVCCLDGFWNCLPHGWCFFLLVHFLNS